MIKTCWSLDFTLTKRHLGFIFIVAGLLAAGAALSAEITNPGGFGTVQKMATFIGAGTLLVGLSLLPLGNRPA